MTVTISWAITGSSTAATATTKQQSRHYFWLGATGRLDIMVIGCVFSLGAVIGVIKHIG